MNLSIKQHYPISGEYLSRALIRLIQTGIKHGIGSVRDGAMAPFVLTAGADGPSTLKLFPAGSPRDCTVRALDYVDALDGDVSLYAYSIYTCLTVPGRNYDVLMVEAGERGMPFGVVYGQAFRPGVGGGPAEKGAPAELYGAGAAAIGATRREVTLRGMAR